MDLICQHCTDGTIIPLRFRVADEEGVLQEFSVKGYKDKTEGGKLKFDCNVIMFA